LLATSITLAVSPNKTKPWALCWNFLDSRA
jgi:hypothetical protein